jgi:hypothetical protein
MFSTCGGYFGTYRPRAFYDFRGLLCSNMVEAESCSSLEDNMGSYLANIGPAVPEIKYAKTS